MIDFKKKLVSIRKIFNSRKKRAIVAILLISASFFVWRTSTGKEEETQIQTAVVKKGMIIVSASASGQVLSVNLMSANTKASGVVNKVYVKDGDYVTRGSKILEIDLDFQGEQKNAAAWSAYLSAKNTLETAKATQFTLQADMFSKWDTFKTLAESDAYDTDEERTLVEFHIPEKNWLAAEMKYKNQAAIITQAQAAVNSSWLTYIQTSPTITAPTNGVITSLMFAEGMSIGILDTGNTTSNQKVATIETSGTPIVSVNLSEIDVSRVELGQKATIILDSIPDKTFTGEVIGVDRIGQSMSGVIQYPAIIRLTSTSDQILPNMTMTANILIDRKDNVLLVPLEAVRTRDGQNFVSIVKDDGLQSIPVEVGLASDTQIEIISGLSEGDVVTAGFSLTSGFGQNGSPFGSSGMRMMRMAH